MLDDLKYIHNRDTKDALGVNEKQWQQYQYNFDFRWEPKNPVDQIVVAGMGGSGLAAKVLKSWPGIPACYEVVQDYELPEYVGQHTLLICSSYSGNTEEVVEVLDRAVKFPEDMRPMILVLASGGKLLERAHTHQLPYVQLPSGYQPRYTLGFQLRALMEVLEQAHKVSGMLGTVHDEADWLKSQMADWTAVVPAAKNPAKQLAQELMGKAPVVYAGPKLFPVAYKWKINFNENAKNIAWCSQFPEFNHNEFLGWLSHPVDKPYAVIDLRSNLEHERIQKRFEVAERLLSGKRPAAHVVQVQGETLLQQMMWAIAYGDFVSLYLALLNNQDPSNIDLLEKFKKVMVE